MNLATTRLFRKVNWEDCIVLHISLGLVSVRDAPILDGEVPDFIEDKEGRIFELEGIRSWDSQHSRRLLGIYVHHKKLPDNVIPFPVP